MEIIKIGEIPFAKTPWGVKGRPVIELPDVGIMNLILEPGEKVPFHKTPGDVLFQVIDGEGTVAIGDEAQQVGTGEIVVSPARIPHALEANANTTFSVLVIKVPNPKKKVKK